MKILIHFVSILLLFGCQNSGSEVLEGTILIQGGTVVDGTGIDAFQADILVKDDIIEFVGQNENIRAEKIINAEGYLVTPGFIDPHTHSLGDLKSVDRNANLNYLTQGVTTVIVGNDGEGPFNIVELSDRLKNKIGTNVAFFIGHGTVREEVMGMEDRDPSQEELSLMKSLILQAMNDGALGLSSGLYYAPGSYSSTEEVIELTKIIQPYGGVYDTHLRDESTYSIGLINAVKEAIAIGDSANVHVNLAHIKALGVDVWGQSTDIIALVEEARSQGVEVTADQYPWPASGTHLENALLNRWVMAGGKAAYFERLHSPELLPRIKSELSENLRKRGGAASILITAEVSDTTLIGYNLKEIADRADRDPVDVALEIIRNGGCRIASFNMNEQDIEKFMTQQWVMTSSDGTNGHPRKYASFPRKLQEYVLSKKILTIEEFVQRSSGLTASTFGFLDRGVLEKGKKADIIIWKPEEFVPRANFSNPTEFSTGIHYLIINGEIAIQDSNYINVLNGDVLKKQ